MCGAGPPLCRPPGAPACWLCSEEVRPPPGAGASSLRRHALALLTSPCARPPPFPSPAWLSDPGTQGRIKQSLFPPLPARLLYGPRVEFSFPKAQFEVRRMHYESNQWVLPNKLLLGWAVERGRASFPKARPGVGACRCHSTRHIVLA